MNIQEFLQVIEMFAPNKQEFMECHNVQQFVANGEPFINLKRWIEKNGLENCMAVFDLFPLSKFVQVLNRVESDGEFMFNSEKCSEGLSILENGQSIRRTVGGQGYKSCLILDPLDRTYEQSIKIKFSGTNGANTACGLGISNEDANLETFIGKTEGGVSYSGDIFLNNNGSNS